jgi:hypothetical protein
MVIGFDYCFSEHSIADTEVAKIILIKDSKGLSLCSDADWNVIQDHLYCHWELLMEKED